MNKKSFKFEFVQFDLKHTVCFTAEVNEEQAKELYTGILEEMVRFPGTAEEYDFMHYDEQLEKYNVTYKDRSSKVEYIGEWFSNEDLKYDDLVQDIKKYSSCKLEDLHSKIGDYDYYFLVKTVDIFDNCDEVRDGTNDNYLMIVKRVRKKEKYHYKTFTQCINIHPEEKEFYGKIFFNSFQCGDDTKKLDIDFAFEEKGLKQDFHKHEKEFLPMYIADVSDFDSYGPHCKILRDIDDLRTIEDVLKKVYEE